MKSSLRIRRPRSLTGSTATLDAEAPTAPPLPSVHRRFVGWLRSLTLASAGRALAASLADIWKAAQLILISRRLPKPASFERIRLNMLSKWLLKSGDGCTVIAFTSRSPGEGVSTVVAGLARSFGTADPGGVLVLDATGSKRGVAHLLGVKPTRAYSPDTRHWITRTESNGVDIFALADAGPLRRGSAKQADTVLASLRSSYRTILIDAGSLAVGWAACWLACSNYRVLVVDSAITTREVLEHHRNELERGGIALDGSILNKRTYPIPRSFYLLAGALS